MGKFYDNSIIPQKLKRNFDVYERINNLGIDLGTFEENVTNITKSGLPIASVVFHESGLVYLSGEGGGEKQMNDDPERVKEGQLAAQKIADNMLRRLHWAIICGNEGGDLNDILYTVKALGMVVSTDVDFDSGPAVMNGFSLRWQSVFGGIGEYFENEKKLFIKIIKKFFIAFKVTKKPLLLIVIKKFFTNFIIFLYIDFLFPRLIY